MKRIPVLLFLVMILASPMHSHAGTTDLGDATVDAYDTTVDTVGETIESCEEAREDMIDKAEKEWDEAKAKIDEVVPDPPDWLEDCIGSISNFNFGLGLSIPSLEGLLEQACRAARKEVQEKKREILREMPRGDVPGPLGKVVKTSRSGSIRVGDNSRQVYNEVWGAINN